MFVHPDRSVTLTPTDAHAIRRLLDAVGHDTLEEVGLESHEAEYLVAIGAHMADAGVGIVQP